MDLKPSSSTGDPAFYKEHEAFLKIAVRKAVFVKVVVTGETVSDEISRCIDTVARINPRIPFIFQPVSEALGPSLAALKLIEHSFFSAAKAKLADVRVIPQMHKVWQVM